MIFKSDVPERLRQLLQFFKQSDSPESRQQLQQVCQHLMQAGEQFDLPAWSELLDLARRAIANPNNSYRTLAPILIKEIKQAQELVLAGRSAEITPDDHLVALAPLEEEVLTADDLALLTSTDASQLLDAADEPLDMDEWLSDSLAMEQSPALSDADLGLDRLEPQPFASNSLAADDLGFGDAFDRSIESEMGIDRQGPEVGMAELNSLADLFEGEVPELGMTWQEEEVVTPIASPIDSDSSNELGDFSDLLFDENLADLALEPSDEDDDLSGLLSQSELRSGAAEVVDLPTLLSAEPATEDTDDFDLSLDFLAEPDSSPAVEAGMDESSLDLSDLLEDSAIPDRGEADESLAGLFEEVGDLTIDPFEALLLDDPAPDASGEANPFEAGLPALEEDGEIDPFAHLDWDDLVESGTEVPSGLDLGFSEELTDQELFLTDFSNPTPGDSETIADVGLSSLMSDFSQSDLEAEAAPELGDFGLGDAELENLDLENLDLENLDSLDLEALDLDSLELGDLQVGDLNLEATDLPEQPETPESIPDPWLAFENASEANLGSFDPASEATSEASSEALSNPWAALDDMPDEAAGFAEEQGMAEWVESAEVSPLTQPEVSLFESLDELLAEEEPALGDLDALFEEPAVQVGADSAVDQAPFDQLAGFAIPDSAPESFPDPFTDLPTDSILIEEVDLSLDVIELSPADPLPSVDSRSDEWMALGDPFAESDFSLDADPPIRAELPVEDLAAAFIADEFNLELEEFDATPLPDASGAIEFQIFDEAAVDLDFGAEIEPGDSEFDLTSLDLDETAQPWVNGASELAALESTDLAEAIDPFDNVFDQDTRDNGEWFAEALTDEALAESTFDFDALLAADPAGDGLAEFVESAPATGSIEDDFTGLDALLGETTEASVVEPNWALTHPLTHLI
ncbi:MAG: hypothetical protein HC881_02345 [Leptolyngbyaceae cyanobacterium SL_7_1]|nr:hypothetical protein [Leptolyngbyaceae cyanobacterium SL_7_1]